MRVGKKFIFDRSKECGFIWCCLAGKKPALFWPTHTFGRSKECRLGKFSSWPQRTWPQLLQDEVRGHKTAFLKSTSKSPMYLKFSVATLDNWKSGSVIKWWFSLFLHVIIQTSFLCTCGKLSDTLNALAFRISIIDYFWENNHFSICYCYQVREL